MTGTGKTISSPLAAKHMTDLAARLAAPRKVIEREFLQMGKQLMACTQLLNETSAAYADMPGALATPEFVRVVGDLQQIPLHAERLKKDNEATQAFLDRVDDLTRRFPEGIDKLAKAVRLIRMFSISARVVAATNGGGTEDVDSFVPEIVRAGEYLSNYVHSFENAFSHIRDSLDAARNQSETFSRTHADLLSGIAADMTRNLEVMERQREWAERQAATHAARTERIGAGVSKAVATLQIGDSTRQRIEHVETVLERLCEVADSETGSEFLSLLAKQVDGSVNDLDNEINDLTSSLRALTQEADAMQERAVTDAETLLSAGDSALGTITESLEHVESMLGQYERGNAALGVAVDQLVAAVGNMLDYLGDLRKIGQSMRLLSLNASIKTNALGDNGRAFQRVAQDLRGLNETITALIEEITANLVKVETTLHEFLESRNGGDDLGTAAVRETLGTSRKSIEGIAALMRDRTALMVETGPAALTQLREALTTVSERQDFCRDWRAISAELIALTSPGAADTAKAREDILAGIFEHYTMKAERDIHDAWLGRSSEASPPDPAGTNETNETEEAEAGLEGIFF